MRENGHWKILPTPSSLVPAGEAIATIQALTIQLHTAMTTAQPIPASTLVSAQRFMQTKY